MSQRATKRARKKDQRRARIEEEIRRYRARRRRRRIISLSIVAAVAAAVAFFGFDVGRRQEPDSKSTPSPGAVACGGEALAPKEAKTYPSPPPMTIDQSKTYTATIETSCGEVQIELADDTSPNTVNSFVFLAREGFYEGLVFHRLVEGFALQGGSPDGQGVGGPGYSVADPVPADFKYVAGTVAMAKSGQEPPGTAGSQFFIVPGTGAENSLPPEYGVLGRVVEGQDVVQRINGLETVDNGQGEKSKPVQTLYIEKITIRES